MLDYIAHYGVGADANPPGRGSGRYPKGSGKRPRADKRKDKTTNFIEKGGVLKKNRVLYRVGAEKGDPTALNRKYFSTNVSDHKLWQDMLYDQNMEYGSVSDLRYKTVEDIKIASNTEVGKQFIQMLSKADDNLLNNVYMKDMKYAYSHYPMKVGTNASKEEQWGNVGTATIAAQTETGRLFIEKMLASGYGGVGDVNGTDVSKDPIIIFNPDKVTKKTYEKVYTSPKEIGYRRHSYKYL